MVRGEAVPQKEEGQADGIIKLSRNSVHTILLSHRSSDAKSNDLSYFYTTADVIWALNCVVTISM